MKSEQYNEDMTDICEFIHKYVPGHDESDDWNKKPEKTLSGGDYLTFERHKQAQPGISRMIECVVSAVKMSRKGISQVYI